MLAKLFIILNSPFNWKISLLVPLSFWVVLHISNIFFIGNIKHLLFTDEPQEASTPRPRNLLAVCVATTRWRSYPDNWQMRVRYLNYNWLSCELQFFLKACGIWQAEKVFLASTVLNGCHIWNLSHFKNPPTCHRTHPDELKLIMLSAARQFSGSWFSQHSCSASTLPWPPALRPSQPKRWGKSWICQIFHVCLSNTLYFITKG